MVLSRQINAEKVLAKSHESAKQRGHASAHTLIEKESRSGAQPDYGTSPIPKYRIPTKGIDAEKAYQMIHNELTLDGNPLLNLASFVHTSMDAYGDKLMAENVSKNLIDSDEYPATTLIHTRAVSMVAKLWNADESKNATGTATTGSSEAIQLGGLAMKKMWQERMRKAGKDEYRPGPNIVMGANAQVALEKFARYFDVECRLVPVSAETNYVMSPEKAMKYVDENTIGVFVILGSTYTGQYEDVEGMSKLLDEYEAKTGNYVPIHVDGASGAFYAPFATPSLKWDFRLPRVVSINASGHKWGKAYVGVGFVVWRDKAHLPKDLIFELHYLGSIEYSFSLNFSRPAAPIIAQYFNFIYLGFEGFRRISLHDAKNARLFARAIENSKYFDVVSVIHKPKNPGGITGVIEKVKGSTASAPTDDIDFYTPALPVVSFKFTADFKKEYPHVQQKSIQTLLRAKGFIVPNYELPPDVQNVEVLRVVMRETFNEDLVERLVIDLIEVTEGLMDDKAHASVVASQTAENASKKVPGESHGKTEKAAASHGEGVKATGHGSVC